MLKISAADQLPLDHYTDLSVGEVLRRARMGYGLEIHQVSARLNIRPEHIAAIEADNIAALPQRVYAIGFVRAYAHFLQLDSDKVVYLFKSQSVGHTASKDLHFPVPASDTRGPAWWMVAASLGAIALIAAFVYYIGAPSNAPEAVPELPKLVQEITPPADAAPTVAPSLPLPTGKLTITATAPSWVELRKAGSADNILISRVLKKGESFEAPDIDNLVISTGNAKALEIYWAGQAVDVFEGRKGVVRDLPISALSLYKTKQD